MRGWQSRPQNEPYTYLAMMKGIYAANAGWVGEKFVEGWRACTYVLQRMIWWSAPMINMILSMRVYTY